MYECCIKDLIIVHPETIISLKYCCDVFMRVIKNLSHDNYCIEMMRKHKSKRPVTPLSAAKNFVRGGKHTLNNVGKARAGLPTIYYHDFIKWCSRQSYLGIPVLGYPFPRKYHEIKAVPPTDNLPFENELAWISQRLNLYADQVCKFRRYVNKFSDNFVKGKYEECEKCLDEIEKEFGRSIWLIKNRFSLYSTWQGLEYQKMYLSEIRESSPDTYAAYISYFISERNEPSVTLGRFISRFEIYLEQSPTPRETKDYLFFEIIGRIPITEYDVRNVLTNEATSSIIDLYEALVSISREVVASQSAISSQVIKLLSQLDGIDDPRIQKILFMVDEGDLAERLKEPPILSSVKRIDSIGHSETKSESFQIDEYNPYELIGLAERLAVNGPPFENLETPGDYLMAHLIEVLGSKVSPDEARSELGKSALNFQSIDLANIIHERALDVISGEVPLQNIHFRRIALINEQFSPSDVLHCKVSDPEKLLSSLSKLFPPCEELRWAGYLLEPNCSALPSSQEHLSAVALGQYRANDQTRFTNTLNQWREIAPLSKYRIRFEVNYLLDQSDIEGAFDNISDLFIRDPGLINSALLNRIRSLEWEILSEFSDKLSTTIVLDLCWRKSPSPEHEAYRRYACEDYLTSCNCDRPSELFNCLPGCNLEQHKYFFREVCVPSVLDSFPAFASSREVEEERRNICTALISLDPENSESYKDEITDISARLRIEDGMRLVDQSRVFVDEEAIKAWALREQEENYNRYKDLLDVGIQTSSDFEIAVTDFIKHKQPLPEHFLALPSGESEDVLIEIASSLLSEFLRSPINGLDAYLSMRVRHGSLSGMLRGPLENRHVINFREAGLNVYKTNEYWLEQLKSTLPENEISAIDKSLKKFSQKYDAVIENLTKEILQIRTNEKKTGAFHIEITSIHFRFLELMLKRAGSFSDFVEWCFNLFWEQLENCLSEVTNHLDKSTKLEIGEMFDELELELESITNSSNIQSLREGIRRARTDVLAALEQIKGWFHRPVSVTGSVYNLNTILEIAIETSLRTLKGFEPTISKTINSEMKFSGTQIAGISDIIFILFDNVFKHSGIGSRPWVRISAEITQGQFVLEFTSEIGPEVQRDDIEIALEGIRNEIASHSYQKSTLGEGGTGLTKIMKIVDPEGKENDALRFGFGEESEFSVLVKAPIIRIK